MKLLILFFVTISLLSCSLQKPSSKSSPFGQERMVASWTSSECQRFRTFWSEQKLENFLREHYRSISGVELYGPEGEKLGRNLTELEIESALRGGTRQTFKYINSFMRSQKKYGQEFFEASLATTKFLVPGESNRLGYKTLRSSFENNCEVMEKEAAKKVHALGSLAAAKLKVYNELVEIDDNGKKLDNVPAFENPYTGILGESGKEIGMILRFSIANPLIRDISIRGKQYSLEFIPGLGMKFLIDGNRSIDLVAMESLAGQGSDHDFFKYSFSPDFSEKAPSNFNTEKNPIKKQAIMNRYNSNPVNHYVMNLVGKRFAQLIPHVMEGVDLESVMDSAHSNIGPHPFVISISDLASMHSDGSFVKKEKLKRPWRIEFAPALDNIEQPRLKNIRDSRPYSVGKYNLDFRHKLGHLKRGDRIYYMVAQNSDGRRFKLGEIRLTSGVLPSQFADKVYFVQHKLDVDRIKGTSIYELGL